MNKTENKIYLLCALLLPIIPLIYLYNKNAEFLSLSHVVIAIIFMMIITAGFFSICYIRFKSFFIGFCSCFVFVVFFFVYNYFYNKFLHFYKNGAFIALISPLLSYLAILIMSRLLSKIQIKNISYSILIFLLVLLGFNFFPLVGIAGAKNESSEEITIKSDFKIDNKSFSPNVYWILCDGLLGFNAMEEYFNDSQESLTSFLEYLGFAINRNAMLESGHKTRIAVPALMCPSFYDLYLSNFLSDHDKAMKLRNDDYYSLFKARFENETINAFKAAGYTTVSMSLDEDVFFPTTDYFYYLAAHYTSESEYEELPYYLKGNGVTDQIFYKDRFCAIKLGDILLGGIANSLIDKIFDNKAPRHSLTTLYSDEPEILKTSPSAMKYSVLINSNYDMLNSLEIEDPKFVIIHEMMAHYPFCFDEDGNIKDDPNSLSSYTQHHAFAVKILTFLVEMILEEDPNAVIVLQADHGLHGYSEEYLIQECGSADAALEIWNNVFSAILVPVEFQNGDEPYAASDPLNISRYLINNFVGENYAYIED